MNVVVDVRLVHNWKLDGGGDAEWLDEKRNQFTGGR